MASLTDTAYVSRVFIKFAGIFLLALMIGRFALNVTVSMWKRAHPQAPPPPTMAFGILPPLTFPQRDWPALTYTLNLPTNVFPAFADRMDVYLMPEKRPRFGALDQTVEDMKSLGFKDKPDARSDSVYRFFRSSPLPTTLDVNIYTGKFTFTLDWSQDPNFFNVKELPADNTAITDIKNYLEKAKLVPDDLNKGDAHITYLKASSGSYKPTVSLSEADFVRVDIFRQYIDSTYEAVTPDPQQGIVRTIIGGNQDKGKIVQVEYNYYPVSYDTKASYYLKTPQQAWTELQQNRGYVAQLDPGVSGVTVRRVSLGYYDDFDPQPYLQPVYIFRGDDNFTAYVPAVYIPTISGTPIPITPHPITPEPTKGGQLLPKAQ